MVKDLFRWCFSGENKDMKPKISFILAIYNAERTLEVCINSIYAQNYTKKDYEVIVIDGGSTDSTLEIVNKFIKKYPNIKLLHNKYRLSEGRKMGKDQGLKASKGNIVIFIDHDNILLGKNWIKEIIKPFDKKEVMISQSMLSYVKGDNFFLRYINTIGVEDPFAVPYSLVSQIEINPDKFQLDNDCYYVTLDKNNVLFGGANGCAFKKSVFSKTKGYTRDVDIFASLAESGVKVAVPTKARIYHKTSSDMLNHLRKKGLYFYRFIKNEYKVRQYSWAKRGNGNSGKLRFFLMVLYNLSIIGPLFLSLKMIARTKELSWILHPFYLFFITLEYGLITLSQFSNFIKYFKNN